ncbi:MAG: LLM class flavin-dependent oxidoreductase [Candidatus Kariarchaeaceae archaeon]|jgi:alkanesulfonate monooxygenase SsuD/methylene tetrahydromethanopterin reductase-like flavin-dependent oxidoreductase (luciferase family)
MTDVMKYGLYIANHGIAETPIDYIEMAIEAEKHGWNGFFLWDHVYDEPNFSLFDPWVTLAGIATRTSKIRIGTTVTPLPRRRPWKVAREVATLDQLSKGRFILGVGIGGGYDYTKFGETINPRQRGEMLDEALEILTELWSGNSYSFKGKYYQIDEVEFHPRPVQEQIPIWVGGTWPIKAPFRRAARYSGTFPLPQDLYPKDVREIIEFIQQIRDPRKSDKFDIVQSIVTSGDPNEDQWVSDYIAAGATWLVECFYPGRGTLEDYFSIIQKGPPEF